ncbi:MAG: radical SAM protein [Nanoarchaeota archaeon]
MIKGKIFLLETPVEEKNKARTVGPNETYPLGMAYLDTVLKKEGFEVRTIDFANWDDEKAMNKIEEIIVEFKPNIVGFSVMTMTRVSTYRAIKKIKEINKDIKIILGGMHPTMMYEQLLLNFPIEAVVIGEGEITTVELANALMQNKSLTKIRGIAYKNGPKVMVTPERDLIQDLDSLPFPNHEAFMNSKRIGVCILSTRGCPYQCSFCCLHEITRRRYRKRSVSNVIAEIEYILNRFPQIKEVEFSDDTLTLDEDRVIEFCKEVVKKRINHRIKFICSGRIKPCSYELLSWMAQAGFREIRFGIETGSRELLKNIHKNVTPEDIIETFKICAHFKDKIKFVKFLMVGFPGETWDTVNETIQLTNELHKHVPMDFFCATVLWVYPGTEIYNLMKSEGDIDDNYWLTDKPCPRYTKEYTESEQSKMADHIAFMGALNRGIPYLVQRVLRKIKENPRYELKRIVWNKFGIKQLMNLVKNKQDLNKSLKIENGI